MRPRGGGGAQTAARGGEAGRAPGFWGTPAVRGEGGSGKRGPGVARARSRRTLRCRRVPHPSSPPRASAAAGHATGAGAGMGARCRHAAPSSPKLIPPKSNLGVRYGGPASGPARACTAPAGPAGPPLRAWRPPRHPPGRPPPARQRPSAPQCTTCHTHSERGRAGLGARPRLTRGPPHSA